VTLTRIRRTIGIALIACASSVATLQAQNSQALLDIDSRAYGYMEAVFLERGLAAPNQARPWSIEELRFELARIDRAGLSEAGTRAYDYLAELADARGLEPTLQGSAGIAFSPEVFARARLAGDSSYSPEAYEWDHGYEERKPVLEIPLDFWLGDSFYAIMDIVGKEEHATVGEADNYSNLIFDDPNARIDLYFPFKAYTALGGPGWSFRFGRDSLSWGNGSTGNMLLSDWSDFYDYVGIALFGKNVKLSSVYTVFDSYDPKTLAQTAYSALIAHRLDLRFFDRLLVSVNESVTFGNDEPELIRDLNYMMIFHNWTIPTRTNSLLSVEVNYTPWLWFELYGQVAMDEFMTQYESDRGGNGGPPIFAYMAGANGTYPLGPGYLKLGLEWAMTSPWMYNRSASPYYYNVRHYYSLTTDNWENSIKPIGYRYGPDAVVWNGKVSWDVPDGLAITAELTYLQRGDKTIADAWNPQATDIAPSGVNPERSLTITLDGSYPVLPWLEAGAGIGFISKRNIGHAAEAWSDDLEFSLFATARY